MATTHDEIIRIARELFHEQGYAETSLGQVARKVGISRTSLFAYFPSKADLIFGEYDESGGMFRQELHQRPTDEPVTASIAAALMAALTFESTEQEAVAFRWGIVDNTPELYGESLQRMEAQRADIAHFIADRKQVPADSLQPQLISGILMSASLTASRDWVRATDTQLSMAEYVMEVLNPILQQSAVYLDSGTSAE